MSKRRLVYVPVGSIKPYEENPKDHDLDELRASFGRFGYTQPILKCERANVLAAGHGRQELLVYLASLAEPPEDWPGHQSWPPDGIIVGRDGVWQQPIILGWSSRNDDELKAYVIADNEQVQKGGWHDDLLAAQLEYLSQNVPDGLSGTGHDAESLQALLRLLAPQPEPNTDPQLDGLSYAVIVQCRDETHQRELLDRFTSELLDVRALMT